MPAGGTAIGFAYFAVAKFLGYTAFCQWVVEPRILERGNAESNLNLISRRNLFSQTSVFF